MMHRLLLLTLLVLGCGSKEPAKSAANAETESPKADTPEVAPTASPKQESKTPSRPAEGATVAPGPASADDLRDVLQAVIDDDALTPYLRLEQPNRFPLRVSGRDLPQNLQLTKMTKPVVIVNDSAKDAKKAVLVFTEIEISGSEATVRYKYDIEGVRGFATLNKPYGRWSIKQSRVAEHGWNSSK
jgi:hypothetical protein